MMLEIALASWVVAAPVANMHAAPEPDAEVVSQAIFGATVPELETAPGWRKIRTADGYTGWVAGRQLAPPGESGYPSGPRTARVESIFANIYRAPDVTTHQPILTVPFDSRLEVVAESGENERRWIEVRLPDDRHGWIQRGDVRFDDRPLSIGETLKLGRRFVGLPYLWGGRSAFGFDCSGFTQMLYRHRGISLPRDTGPQAAWEGLKPVRRDKLLPGDLLFFGEKGAGISHTGMYIGDGKFLNATAYRRPMVQISSLSDPHWAERLLACRRPKRTAQE